MSRKERTLFVCCVLAFFAFSFRNYFVCDDFEFLGRISFANASWYFTHSWGYGNEYRPLLVYSYALDRALGGIDPVVYHITNTLIHAANALLVASIFARSGRWRTYPVLTAAIFAANPVTHESVLWVSGRPVILSAFFLLLALWASLRAPAAKYPRLWWAVVYGSFLAGLLTYEAEIILPLLMVLVNRWAEGTRRIPIPWLHIGVLCAMAGVYLVCWNVFFEFKITRFPVEHSWSNAFLSLSTALRHCFHGSSRLAIAGLYLLLLCALWLQRERRRVFLFALIWFTAAYLPFIVVHGYADRFAYLSSAAVALVLSSCIAALVARNRIAGWACACVLMLVLITGMTGRMMVWRTAGEIARKIPLEIEQLHPALPHGTPIVLLNVPPMYRDAYVYLTGVERAVRLQYADPSLRVYRRDYAALPGSTIVMDCANGVVRDVGPLDLFRRLAE